MNNLFLGISLTICWYILSGRLDITFTLLGFASVLGIILFTKRLRFYQTFTLRPSYKFLLYVIWLVKEIITSSFTVSRMIWQKDLTNYINPREIWITTTVLNDAKLTLYANSITLTPGTICLGLEQNQIYVHALSDHGIKQLKNGVMEHKIKEI